MGEQLIRGTKVFVLVTLPSHAHLPLPYAPLPSRAALEGKVYAGSVIAAATRANANCVGFIRVDNKRISVDRYVLSCAASPTVTLCPSP